MNNNHKIGLILCLLPILGVALPSDAKKPYNVSSHTVRYDRKTHTTVYTGDVIATQGSTRLTGNKVILITDPKTHNIKELIAYGTLAHYTTLPGNNKKRLHAQAETIKYWPSQYKTELLIKARVTQAKNVFTGEQIWYDIKNESVYTDHHTKNARTKIIIQPQDVHPS